MKEEKKSDSKYYLALVLIAQLCLGLPYLGRIPLVFVDEAWDSALAYNIAEKGKLCHPFIECLGGMEFHYLPNRLVLPLFCAGVFKFTGCTIMTGRLASQFFALVALLGLYALARKWFGCKQAFFITLLCILHPWFFEISRRIRPEIYYSALSTVYLLLLVQYFETGSRVMAFLSGLVAGLLALTHVNGIILAFAISVGAVIWLRKESIWRLLLWSVFGFTIVILPYLIYLGWAMHSPDVNMRQQLQVVFLFSVNPIRRELGRWRGFLLFPKLLPLGVIMAAAWFLSWYRSSRQEKLVATIVALYSFLLLFGIGTPRYLSATLPYWSVLIGRLVWRSANWTHSFRWRLRPGLALAACTVAMYIVISTTQVSNMLFSLRNADFDRVVDKIAETVKPTDRVHADPIFWFGRDKFTYGPYIITYEGMELKDCVKWSRKHKFKYVVRTSWHISPPFWADKSAQKMPDFRKNSVGDHLCKLYGTKIREFYDPYYGQIEIYSLDWTKWYYRSSVEWTSE